MPIITGSKSAKRLDRIGSSSSRSIRNFSTAGTAFLLASFAAGARGFAPSEATPADARVLSNLLTSYIRPKRLLIPTIFDALFQQPPMRPRGRDSHHHPSAHKTSQIIVSTTSHTIDEKPSLCHHHRNKAQRSSRITQIIAAGHDGR